MRAFVCFSGGKGIAVKVEHILAILYIVGMYMIISLRTSHIPHRIFQSDYVCVQSFDMQIIISCQI